MNQGTRSVSKEHLTRILLSTDAPLFAVLDAARDPRVLAFVGKADGEVQSLYEGPKGQKLAEVAPYLVRFFPHSVSLSALIAEGWGQSWGIFLTSPDSFHLVRRHLRRFLQVKTEQGRALLFRFYDPRVLRVFLPTCDPQQTEQMFGEIRCFMMEEEGGEALLRFSNDGQAVKREVLPLY